jgi:hypothetical protein
LVGGAISQNRRYAMNSPETLQEKIDDLDTELKNERLKPIAENMRSLLAWLEEAEDADAEGILEMPDYVLDDLKTAKNALTRLVDWLDEASLRGE